MSRTGIKRGLYLLPNLFTTGGLFLGFFSIVKALHHDFVMASWLIIVAGMVDNFDGRIARATNSESDFGLQYDSLVDLVSFGVAPAVLIYSWSLASFNRLGWMAAFVYLACGCLRLARFNVQVHTVEKNFFQGLPIPVGAAALAYTVIFHHWLYGSIIPLQKWWLLALTVGLSLLMISNIRYRSFKQFNFRSRQPILTLVLVVGGIAVAGAEPELVLSGLCVLYLVAGIVESSVRFMKQRQVAVRAQERRAARRAKRVLEEKVRSLPRKKVGMQ